MEAQERGGATTSGVATGATLKKWSKWAQGMFKVRPVVEMLWSLSNASAPGGALLGRARLLLCCSAAVQLTGRALRARRPAHAEGQAPRQRALVQPRGRDGRQGVQRRAAAQRAASGATTQGGRHARAACGRAPPASRARTHDAAKRTAAPQRREAHGPNAAPRAAAPPSPRPCAARVARGAAGAAGRRKAGLAGEHIRKLLRGGGCPAPPRAEGCFITRTARAQARSTELALLAASKRATHLCRARLAGLRIQSPRRDPASRLAGPAAGC